MAKPQAPELKDGDRDRLEKILKKGTAQAREARRERILLLKAKGESASAIAGKLGVCRTTVLRCLKKCKSGGLERALHERASSKMHGCRNGMGYRRRVPKARRPQASRASAERCPACKACQRECREREAA